MSEPPLTPRARVVLRFADRSEVCLGPIDGAEPCDLALVDRVLRLRLEAVREGHSVVLADVDADLAALLDLLGVRDLLR